MTNDAQMPERIWVWSEDDDFLRAKPHGVQHGVEYVRADRCASRQQVRATNDVWMAAIAVVADLRNRQAAGGSSFAALNHAVGALDDARRIALTPQPAAPTDNTALAEKSILELQRMLEFEDRPGPRRDAIFAALASREAPQPEAHPDDLTVDRFAAAMKAKLAKKRTDGRSGWGSKDECSAETLSRMLREHVEKGDPLDVGNLAMMLHQRGEKIRPAICNHAHPPQPSETVAAAARLIGEARLWLDTGFALAGETLDYSPESISQILDKLDAALRALKGEQ